MSLSSVFSLLLLLLITLSLTPTMAQTPPLTTFALPGDKVFPESIAYQPTTGDFYVGGLLDGSVLRGNTARSTADVFLPAGSDGRISAAGIKIDKRGRLFIAAGQSGKLFVYQTQTKTLLGTFQVKAANTVVNDIVIMPNGDAYVTDTSNPALYRVQEKNGQLSFEEWLSFTGTVVDYQPGYNINGIVASADEHYLVVVQTRTGKLFRIEIATKAVQEIPVAGGPLLHGDGLALDGNTLYVARNADNTIAVASLSADFSQATIIKTYTDLAFQFPTAVAKTATGLLIVGAQLDKMQSQPSLPFRVISLSLK